MFLTTACLQMNKTKFELRNAFWHQFGSLRIDLQYFPTFILIPQESSPFFAVLILAPTSLWVVTGFLRLLLLQRPLSSKPAVHVVKEWVGWRPAFVHEWKDDSEFFLVIPSLEAWIGNSAMILSEPQILLILCHSWN